VHAIAKVYISNNPEIKGAIPAAKIRSNTSKDTPPHINNIACI